jgi:transcriptional antiterminator NusG
MSEELKNEEFQDGAGVPPPADLAPAEGADADTAPGVPPPEVPAPAPGAVAAPAPSPTPAVAAPVEPPASAPAPLAAVLPAVLPPAAAPVELPASVAPPAALPVAVPVAVLAAAAPLEAQPGEPAPSRIEGSAVEGSKPAETKRQPVMPSIPLPLGAAMIELPSDEVTPDELKWYVVTTYSGFETKAKQALEERIKKSPFVHLFGEVLVPTEAPPEGKKKAAARSFFPGYIFVQMVMNETTWTLVKGTPRVTNFVGNQKPTPVPPEQIAEIQRQISEGAIKAKPEVMFSEGDRVRVTQGPFLNMIGTVSTINPVKQVVRVLVSIFGRATPVDLEYHQVEKLP